jgi:hypothetical protein
MKLLKYNIVNESEINDNEKVDILIKECLHVKNELSKILLMVLKETSNSKIREEVAYALIDNFKNDEIIPVLIELIKKPELKNHNASLVYALGEYSDCKEYLEFLTDLVLYYDYHTGLNAFNIIISMPMPFDENIVKRQLEKLSVNILDSDREVLVNDLISFYSEILENQND